MKKFFSLAVLVILSSIIVVQATAQSTIVLDNPDTKPVPVKITNPAAQGQVKNPFTELSTTSNGVTTLTIKGSANQNEVKVVEYIMGTGVGASKIKVTFKTIEFNYYFNTVNNIPVNTFSGMINIVLKKDEFVTFSIDGSGGNNILASGYTINLK